MSIKKSGIVISIIILMAYGLITCTPQQCLDETEAYVKVYFFNEAVNKLQAPDSITVYGLNMSFSRIYSKAVNIQPALLPLNPSSESSTFVIRINGGTDTVKLTYSSFPHLISKECGYSFFYTLDTTRSFTPHKIKYLKHINGNITNLHSENIRITY